MDGDGRLIRTSALEGTTTGCYVHIDADERVTMMEANVASAPAMISCTFPGGKRPPHDGTVQQVDIYMDGDRLGALMPDGRTIWAGDGCLARYTGHYMIWQTYNVIAPNLRPLSEAVRAETEPLVLGDPRGVELPY